ncbi:transcriptional regulator [Spirulina major CS-329]|uniref:helix-turn-helix domain-containing protein n=1 Tax=Spirulina TaxID=1154 RepID=UPI00232D6C8E|nr:MULTISPECIES: transcriptional regulator [Spirulina]MDB9494308.1 transcriptional regulator [Spirulina subsalsa CS-330]MDB9502799.1 transcriptional regulator [Spirulina major CS-329]
MTLTFDHKRYGQLLAETLPAVITTEAEYDRILAITEPLFFSNDLEPEAEMLLDLLVQLIKQYEEQHYPMPEVKPHVMLQHLIESKGIRQADLVGVIGSSGVVSEVVNGKRAISKAQAKALGDYFQISPSVFI